MSNSNFKNYISWFVIFIAGLSILFSIKNCSDNSNTIDRIDNVVKIMQTDSLSLANRDSLVQVIQLKNFKEDFYLNQLSIQSDWMIAYVTILFGIFGLVGYVFFLNKLNILSEELNEMFSKENKKLIDELGELKKMKPELYSAKANTLALVSELYKISYKDSISSYQFILASISNSVSAFELEEGDEKRKTFKTIEINLDVGLEYLKKIETNSGLNESFKEKIELDKLFKDLRIIEESNESILKNFAAENRVIINRLIN